MRVVIDMIQDHPNTVAICDLCVCLFLGWHFQFDLFIWTDKALHRLLLRRKPVALWLTHFALGRLQESMRRVHWISSAIWSANFAIQRCRYYIYKYT